VRGTGGGGAAGAGLDLGPVDVVLEIAPGARPWSAFQPLLHLLCEARPEMVHALQQGFAGARHVVVLAAEGRDLVRVLPDRSVDRVLVIDGVEELGAPAGRQLLGEYERVARRQVVVRVPPESVGAAGRSVLDGSWRLISPRGDGTGAAPGPECPFWAVKHVDRGEQLGLPVKVAVVSPVFPPQDSGQAIMLGRLLQGVRPEDYCLVSSGNDAAPLFPHVLLPNSLGTLAGRYHRLTPLAIPWGAHALNRLGYAGRQVLAHAREICGVLRRERCGAVVACTGELIDFPAAYLASRRLGLPFYAYCFDLWSHQGVTRLERAWARWAERVVLRGAARVVVPNEFLADEYRRRYGIHPSVIHNPAAPEDGHVGPVPWPARPGEVRIVYTGQVYAAQQDALGNLVTAIARMGRPDVKLHVYTAQPAERLRRQGLDGPVIFHAHLPPSRIAQVQREADLLYLPLAFRSPYPHIIRTSAPSKLGDYLSSGRAILAHVPPDSFVKSYLARHDCGVVVDRPDPGLLAAAVERLIEDGDLRERLGRNARLRARADFRVSDARRRFAEVLAPPGPP
jgi:glycosyltransferase involved in cell wall biosynthesis